MKNWSALLFWGYQEETSTRYVPVDLRLHYARSHFTLVSSKNTAELHTVGVTAQNVGTLPTSVHSPLAEREACASSPHLANKKTERYFSLVESTPSYSLKID